MAVIIATSYTTVQIQTSSSVLKKLKLPTIYDKNVYVLEYLKQVKLHHNRHFQRNKKKMWCDLPFVQWWQKSARDLW